MNLPSVIILLQLVLSLLSSNPSPQNQVLAVQVVNLATKSLSAQIESAPAVSQPVVTQPVPVQPTYTPPSNPVYVPPVQTQNSPTLGNAEATNTPNIVIVPAPIYTCQKIISPSLIYAWVDQFGTIATETEDIWSGENLRDQIAAEKSPCLNPMP